MRRRPAVGLEQLEDRTVLDSVPSDPFLFTPVPGTAPLVLHIHPHLSILIGHTPVTILAGIGIETVGDLPLHTHDDSGTIHVESPVTRLFRLGDFFSVWGQPFSSQQVLGFQADPHHAIRMTVDGTPSDAFASQPLWDGEQIVIRYVRVNPQPHLHRHGHGIASKVYLRGLHGHQRG